MKYNSLLLEEGGGIIDRTKQGDRNFGATVIIGLGGTGSDAVIRLKREVYKQLKPDDENAVIPKYDNIKYLIIDSDASKVNASKGKLSDIDEATEFFSLSNKAIKTTFSAKTIMENRREMDWLDYEHISIEEADAGAGGIRQVGRFLLVDKAETLYEKIKSTFTRALTGSNGELTVHICSGLSGGTGSGIFLDVCYLVRKALQEIGKSDSRVCGYFFLPDVNLSVPVIATEPFLSNHLSVNGFAALKELDYCMNFEKNKDSFKMNYGFKVIDTRQKPVDLCYLISTTNESGEVIKNGYDYAMGVVTEFIISSLAKVQLSSEDFSDLEKHFLDFKKHFLAVNARKLHHGGGLEYSVLGLSVAEMPFTEIATYLGYKLFECYADMYDRIPTERERDDFLTQLKYENIKKALTKGCSEKIEFPSTYDVKMFKRNGNAKFVEVADTYLAKNKGEMEKNCQTFLEGMKEGIIPSNRASLIGRTYKILCDKYVMQLAYGPFFAQRMLYGRNNRNLVHAVDDFIKQNQIELEAELHQSDICNENYDIALENMQKANFITERKRFLEYLYALNNLYVHYYRVAMYETMDTILREYKEQLMKLNHNFFRVLTTVLDTLRNTFKENGQVLTEDVRTGTTCSWKILSVSDIKNDLDLEVSRLDLQQTWYELMKSMMNNYTKWISGDENEIAKLISDFILETFEETTQKTITDYLKVKFKADDSDVLADSIENSIINELKRKAVPLFWKNPMYRKEISVETKLTIPYNSSKIKMAANNYNMKEIISISESRIIDRISMLLCSYDGLPMYAYQGLFELQEKYEKYTWAGRHLYERGEVNWNEWLPSPIPASFRIGVPVKRIEERNKQLLKEFEKAELIGIIKYRKEGWWITTKEGKDIKIETVTGAATGCERQVMLDFYLKAPVLNKIVQEELKKWENSCKK